MIEYVLIAILMLKMSFISFQNVYYIITLDLSIFDHIIGKKRSAFKLVQLFNAENVKIVCNLRVSLL